MSSEGNDSFRLANDPAMPKPGDIVGERYTIEKALGEGGFAAVFKAVDNRTGGYVAIKVLDPLMSRRPEFRQRFEAEVRTAAKLKHANTIRIFDYGETSQTDASGRTIPGCLYLVMELLQGKALDELLKERGPMPPEMVRQVAIQVLRSLQEAHDNKIIHRDIKPGNIFMLDFQDELSVKVLDFGIAKSMDDDSSGLTSTGQVMCSPHYVAPERIVDHQTVAASDIYSLGITMIELLEGRPPYEGDTPMQVIMMHANRNTTVPLEDATRFGPLAGVIGKATAKNLNDRYQSAREMVTDLLAGSPTTSPFGVTPTLVTPVPLDPVVASPSNTEWTPADHALYQSQTVARKKGPAFIVFAIVLLALLASGAVLLALSKKNKEDGPATTTQAPQSPTENSQSSVSPPASQVVIDSIPSGALVTINGSSFGSTPLHLEESALPASPFNLVAQHSDGRVVEAVYATLDELRNVTLQFPPLEDVVTPPSGEAAEENGQGATPEAPLSRSDASSAPTETPRRSTNSRNETSTPTNDGGASDSGSGNNSAGGNTGSGTSSSEGRNSSGGTTRPNEVIEIPTLPSGGYGGSGRGSRGGSYFGN